MSFLSSALGGLADIFGAGLNYYSQHEATKWQKEQYYHNLEYNKPINQMARLAEAGINPHMAYSKGTINNIASPAPNISAPQIDVPDFAGKVEQYINMKKMSADIQNMEETNKNIQEQNKKIAAETKKAEAEARIAEHDAKIIEKSPTSSRANETQSLAQIFGSYLGLVKEGYTNIFDFDKYGLPFFLPHVEKRKDGDYVRTSRLNNGEVLHYTRTGVGNQSRWLRLR